MRKIKLELYLLKHFVCAVAGSLLLISCGGGGSVGNDEGSITSSTSPEGQAQQTLTTIEPYTIDIHFNVVDFSFDPKQVSDEEIFNITIRDEGGNVLASKDEKLSTDGTLSTSFTIKDLPPSIQEVYLENSNGKIKISAIGFKEKDETSDTISMNPTEDVLSKIVIKSKTLSSLSEESLKKARKELEDLSTATILDLSEELKKLEVKADISDTTLDPDVQDIVYKLEDIVKVKTTASYANEYKLEKFKIAISDSKKKSATEVKLRILGILKYLFVFTPDWMDSEIDFERPNLFLSLAMGETNYQKHARDANAELLSSFDFLKSLKLLLKNKTKIIEGRDLQLKKDFILLYHSLSKKTIGSHTGVELIDKGPSEYKNIPFETFCTIVYRAPSQKVNLAELFVDCSKLVDLINSKNFPVNVHDLRLTLTRRVLEEIEAGGYIPHQSLNIRLTGASYGMCWRPNDRSSLCGNEDEAGTSKLAPLSDRQFVNYLLSKEFESRISDANFNQ